MRSLIPPASRVLPLLFLTMQAVAQSNTDSSGPEGQINPVLAEVVVTAQKRTENSQNVPIAIASVSADSLEHNQIGGTRDLQFAVPTLTYTSLANNGQPFMRGIGSDTSAPNFDVSVATYVDGVFLSSPSAVMQGLLGIDRIEVLQGPQGTLYGRNAVGGAINVYTLTPTKSLESKVSATYGNYDRKTLNGYLSGALTDTLSAGLYAAFNQRDTYYDKTHTDLPEPNHETDWGLRGKAVFEPTDIVKLTASIEYLRSKGFEGAAFRNIQPDALSYALGAPQDIQRYRIDSTDAQFIEVETLSASIREEVDLGWASVLGISGYRDLELSAADDIDGTSLPFLVSAAGSIPSKQFSQELQLISPSGGSLEWIVGAYYFHEKTGYEPVISAGRGGFIFPAPITESRDNSYLKIKSLAAFAQATKSLDSIAEGLRLTLGARYTIDDKSFSDESWFTDEAGNQIGDRTFYPEKSKKWKKVTPRVVVDYRRGGTLYYASYGKGFKSGAYNASSPGDPGPVDPENLAAYEIGTKTDFSGGRVRLNLAAYYYDFKDIQMQQVTQTLGGGGRVRVQNAAAAEIYGFEPTLTAAVTEHLTVNASAAWMHSEYSDFPNVASYDLGPAGNPAAVYDATGNELQRAPKLVTSVGADYSYTVSNGAVWDASAKWYHNDGFFWEATNRFKQDAYDLTNVSLSYTFPNQRTSVTGFVANAGDAYYANSVLLLPFGLLTSDGEPRMYGMTVSWKY